MISAAALTCGTILSLTVTVSSAAQGATDAGLALILAAGLVGGVPAGVRLAERVSDASLRLAVSLLLIGVGLLSLIKGTKALVGSG